MSTKYFLVIAAALVAFGNVLAGCSQTASAEREQNVFYNVTHQAESFGFSGETFYKLQAAFNTQHPSDFRSAFYYYNYGCGYFYTNKKDELTALQYADSMLQVCDEMHAVSHQAELAIANLSAGDILFALKRYNEACEYFYKGRIAAEKSGDQYTLSEYNYRLGMAMYRKGSYDAAAHYFIDAFKQAGSRKNSFSDFYRRQEILNNTALSYLHNSKADSAIWYSNKGLAYIANNKNNYTADKSELIQVAQGVQYGTLGRAYLQKHDTTGIALLEKSININKLPGRDKGNALQVQAYLAQYYLDSVRPVQLTKANALLQDLQHGLDTVYDEEAAIDWNALMSRYYALQNNKAEAYTYLLRYNALHNQQVAANKTLTETNINSSLKLQQNRYEMDLLQKDNQLEALYLKIAVLLCVLTGIILFLIVKNWKKEKETSRKLCKLNKQVEQQKIELEVTVKQLDKQIQAKNYILRVIAHDLRNPISAISTLTRIVSEEYENEEDNKEFLEMAQSACKDSLSMIDSIMQLAQQDKSETLKRQVFDVNEAVMDCVALLRFKAGEKHQNIVLHHAKTPQYTFADIDKINRVVNNLVVNAIKFSFPNSTIDVYIKDKKDDVEIEVKDEGIGIPEDMQEKVFDVFTEAKRKGTSKEATFGLGLSICKQLIEAHDGKIWLESQEGLGTAFHVQLHKHLLPQLQQQKREAATV